MSTLHTLQQGKHAACRRARALCLSGCALCILGFLVQLSSWCSLLLTFETETKFFFLVPDNRTFTLHLCKQNNYCCFLLTPGPQSFCYHPEIPMGIKLKNQAEQRFFFFFLPESISWSWEALSFTVCVQRTFFLDEWLTPLLVSSFTKSPIACYLTLTLGSHPGGEKIAISLPTGATGRLAEGP